MEKIDTIKDLKGKRIREILIEEYYSKKNGIVYWHYRFNGGNWHKEKTPHKELPWIELKETLAP